jgi:hypothetical protein
MLGTQHFHRHRAVVTPVLSEVHGGHAARAELAIERVAVCERV